MAHEKKLSIRLTATGGEKLRREFGRLGKDGKHAFDKITRSTKPASLELKAVNASARALNGVFRQAAGLIAAYAGIQGVSRSLGFIVSSNREFEKLHASLKTVTGSMQGADQAFKMIEDFASETPFNVEQITEAFIKLKALGLDPSADALRSYGNTASAMGKNLMQFVEAIADAATGEFERLKEFGIKARTQGEKVSFTFQGVTTTVGKNAAEIETYLRKIGKVQFAGAMSDQMKTLNGIFSNIQDNCSKLAREVGAGGLNDAIRDVATSLKQATDSGKSAAHALGKTLGNVVRETAHVLGLLFHNAELVIQSLKALLIARTVGKAVTVMNVAIASSATAVSALGTASAATTARIAIMEGATKLATIAMVGLNRAMALVGGKAGVAILVGFALYKLVQSHDAAAKAAKDHAAELEELRSKLKKTADDINKVNQASRDEALALWTEKLKTAQKNIKSVQQQIKLERVIGLFDHLFYLHRNLNSQVGKIKTAFQDGKLSLEQYQAALWKLAVKYPDLTPHVKYIKEQVQVLQAAQLAATRANQEINRIQAQGLAETKKEVSKTLAQTTERDLKKSKLWQDGLTRGFLKVKDAAQDMAAQTEKFVVNAFSNMENALVNFVTKGKLDFRGFVDSIIADLVRIQIRRAITVPLANALSSINFGAMFGAAHSGGVIGSDKLSARIVDPAVFEHAPRHHSGGIVGNEIPIVAKRGEAVFTPAQMRLLTINNKKSEAVKVFVNVHNAAPNIHARTQTTRLSGGNIQLDVIVEQIEGKLAHNIARGTGLSTTLEHHYGLNRAAGSYR